MAAEELNKAVAMAPAEIDEVATSAATASRRLCELKARALNLTRYGTAESDVDTELVEIKRCEADFGILMEKLRPIIQRAARRIARGDPRRVDFGDVAFSHVAAKIGKESEFVSHERRGTPGGQASVYSGFERWLAKVLARKAIDEWRRDVGAREDPSQAPQDVVGAGFVTEGRIEAEWRSDAEAEVVRDLPVGFTEEEERILERFHPRQRHLLLYCAGLWMLVSNERRESWKEWPTPSRWECEELSPVARANCFALACAEDECARRLQLPPLEVADPDPEAEFARIQSKHEQWVAQNLLRHYWGLLECDTAWQHTLKYVAPAEIKRLDAVSTSLSRELLVLWLQLDLWILLDHSRRWFDWLEALGVANRGDCNFVRIFRHRPLDPGDGNATSDCGLHRPKLEEAAKLAGVDASIPGLAARILGEKPHLEAIISERDLLRDRSNAQLPVPFERIRTAGNSHESPS